MKMIKVLVTLVAILAVTFFFTPTDFHVERSIIIDASPADVFSEVNTLQRWEHWSPWVAKDSTLETVYRGPAAGVGAESRWTSENSGTGKQVITESDPSSHIRTHLDFGPRGEADGEFDFAKNGQQTRVTWSMSGQSDGFPGRYFNLLMDSMLGSDFESGLWRLKKHVEGMKLAPTMTP